MKIVGWLMISVILFSILSFSGCTSQESIPTLSLSPTTATYNISSRCEIVATVTQNGTPVSGVAVRFEFDPLSCHYPPNLTGNESYDREVHEWEAPLICEGEYFSPLISEHWKKEKVYSATNNYVYCSTGPGGEPAGFAYTGIKPGTDTIVVSANVSGHELKKTATITWQYPSLSRDVNGPARETINMGNYTVLEMKIEIADAQLAGPWLLNIGNSPSNNGAGGDNGDFANDSELDVTSNETNPNFILQLRANQYFSTPGAVLANLTNLFPPATNTPTWILRVKIADQKMCALVENTGALRDVESPFIFRLGGADSEAVGGYNDFIYYAAFNCVIKDTPGRTGSGVTKVTFMWRNTWPDWEIP
jgi:hypothetical protein